MVYDCFLIFNELDLLEIRLNILSPVVDKFIIVEADRTHSNQQKQFFFEQNKNRYAKFLNKIIYIKITKYPLLKTSWVLENYQRNMITEGIKNCIPDDIILISDLDEIPNPDVIRNYKKDGIFQLEQAACYYFLNYRNILQKYWHGTRILTYGDILRNATDDYSYSYNNTFIENLNQGCTPTKIRMIKDFPVIRNGGWHFSYLGGIEQIKYKIKSFGHQEFNNERFLDDVVLKRKIKYGIDFFRPKDNRFIPVKLTNKYLPEYIIEHHDKYANLLNNDINIFRNICIITITYTYQFLRQFYRRIRKLVR
jgi:beta-1,4-mannosyl-glycoprotein beta-1,4-N-acetylglucosaminyltransferase